MPYFRPTEQEERSFLSVLRHTVLEGPLKLMRFSDSARGHEGGRGRRDPKTGLYGSYWMYAAEVEEIVAGIDSTGPYGIAILKEVSARWALCDDWGDLGRAWVLSIPAGKTLNAYCGFAKFQPKVSVAAQRNTGRKTDNSYPGGSMQFVVRLDDEECQWISGPLRTLDISAKKLVAAVGG